MNAREEELEARRAEREGASVKDTQLREAVRTILKGFDQGVFVRAIANDTDPTWAIKLFPFLRAIAVAQLIVEADDV